MRLLSDEPLAFYVLLDIAPDLLTPLWAREQLPPSGSTGVSAARVDDQLPGLTRPTVSDWFR
jgi:hypothetical protein